MVIGVLERRGEIGLRRALGATRGHVAGQFVVESLLLATIGGVAGMAIGAAITIGVADQRHWTVQIPTVADLGWPGRGAGGRGGGRAVPGAARRAAGPHRRAPQRLTRPPGAAERAGSGRA